MLRDDVKTTQFMRPLFEFSGACAGCGETPYVKLLTQLFGDRLLIANATGCSSIYGGNLPTTPYTTDACGRGPAWANSLFEDNAEFGLGFRASLDQSRVFAEVLLRGQAGLLGDDLVTSILAADQTTEAGINAQRERVVALRKALAGQTTREARTLDQIADYLVDKSVWIVGGDGWAYDIGFGGLDHVIASGRNVNILVLDTEVYSNTGGQQSKSTPLGAVAKFSMAGKALPKKDLGLIATTYGSVYVARDCARCQGRPYGLGLPRGGKLSRPVADHRLQPLRRPRLQPVARPRTTETRRRLRLLAAVPLRSAPRREGRKPDEARLRRAQGPADGLHPQRNPLPDAGTHQPGTLRHAPGNGRGVRQGTLRPLSTNGRLQRDRRRPSETTTPNA